MTSRPVYSIPFYENAQLVYPPGVGILVFQAEPTHTYVVREIHLHGIFGSSSDTAEVGWTFGGGSLLVPLVQIDGTTGIPVIQPLRLVMSPELYLYTSVVVSGPGPQLGIYISGYQLTLP